MRILAIADLLLTVEMMEHGFDALKAEGHEVIIREWKHPDIKTLQADNLIVEQQGANAIDLPDDLIHDIAGFDMVIVQFAPIGAKLIAMAKKLRYIGVLRAGSENVDSKAAEAKGMKVIATPGRNARAVAEFTVGMILSETRNIARTHAAMRQGIFMKDSPNSQAIPELYRKVVGLIGFGYIGSLVAHFLSVFDCRVIVYDPYLKEKPTGIELVGSLDKLLAESDIVSMHMRLSSDTQRMIGANEFKLMRKNAYFINTARSGLVDQSALVEALRTKTIMGAAIDVFDREPIPPGDPILSLDNITLTPHLAGSTRDAFANTPLLFSERFIRDHS